MRGLPLSCRKRASRALFVATALAGIGVTGASADCDTTAPALTGADVVPSLVVVDAAPATVLCRMWVQDLQSTTVGPTCSFTSPSGMKRLLCTATGSTQAYADDPNTRLFTCPITVPRFEEAGAWTADPFTVSDVAGNSAQVTLPVELDVADSAPDMIPPVVLTASLAPPTVDVTSAPASVTCSMQVGDVNSGVDTTTCVLMSTTPPPNGLPAQSAGCVAASPSSGTRQSGVFSCNVPIPAHATPGAWMLMSAVAVDAAGNISYPVPQFAQAIVTDGAPDVAPPVIVGFDVTPTAVDTTPAPHALTCHVHVQDATSGVQSIGCQFNSPPLGTAPNTYSQSTSCVTNVPDSGTILDGRYSCTAVLPISAVGGAWTTVAAAIDNTGYTSSQTGTPVNVTCDTSYGAYDLRIGVSRDRVYWTWPQPMQIYHTYRGDLPGLPANEWGDCLGESFAQGYFSDGQSPVPGHGYYYIVSYALGYSDYGYGEASDGTPRTPRHMCP